MKLILRSDLKGLGKRGDIVEVAAGFGRNYLLPRGLAIAASDGAVDQAGRMRRARDLRDATDREAAQTIASTLVPKIIEITAKAGNEGRLFGSVTSADVVAAVEDQTGIRIDRHRVEECGGLRRKAELAQSCRQHRGAAMHRARDVGQPFRAVIDRVHRGDHRQQHLRGADVGGRLFATDMLLAGLQRQPIGRLPP